MEKIQSTQVYVTIQPNNKIKITEVSPDKSRKTKYIYDPIEDSLEIKSIKKPKNNVQSLNSNIKKVAAKKFALLASIFGVTVGGLIGANTFKPDSVEPEKNISTELTFEEVPEEDSTIVIEEPYFDSAQEQIGETVKKDILKDIPDENSPEGAIIKQEADQALLELENKQGDVSVYFDNFCNSLDLTEQEAMHYITYLCNSPEWADGCITPLLFLADIMHESEYDPDKVGDGGAALGFGQFHKIAVDQVNMTFGTDYTYEDRQDPQKALEMMALLMRYCADCTNSTEGMLAMYNVGHPGAINTSKGKAYVSAVYGRLDNNY